MQRSTLRPYVATACSSLVLSLSLLTGCSGDAASPAPLDSSTSPTSPGTGESSPSPSPDSSPTGSGTSAGPPPLPPEARKLTRAGGGAFARHVIQVINYSVATLDTKPLTQLSTSDCDACNSIIDRLASIRRNGGHIEGGRWSVVQVLVLDGGTRAARQVNVAVDYAKQISVRRQGAKPRRFPGGRGVFTFDLRSSHDRWRVASLRAAST